MQFIICHYIEWIIYFPPFLTVLPLHGHFCPPSSSSPSPLLLCLRHWRWMGYTSPTAARVHPPLLSSLHLIYFSFHRVATTVLETTRPTHHCPTPWERSDQIVSVSGWAVGVGDLALALKGRDPMESSYPPSAPSSCPFPSPSPSPIVATQGRCYRC